MQGSKGAQIRIYGAYTLSNFSEFESERQEPEGAPAGMDLRRELIHASKKRNGTTYNNNNNGSHCGSSELTQELSEMRQENGRQYCDYRSPRANTSSPSRFMESSSSDIFPLSRRTPVERKNRVPRSTVHPGVVCDIPVKPFPFLVNVSRLSGSTSNLVTEDRPSSGLGLGSGPSSVISDNYRRDWANIRGSSNAGRASSVASFPGYTSDHLRQSSIDLTPLDSPHVNHKKKSQLYQKYSHSPPRSPTIPPMSALSSNISDLTEPEKDGQSSLLTSMPSSGVFQPKPFNKTKGFKPVAFNPAIKLTSTTVQ